MTDEEIIHSIPIGERELITAERAAYYLSLNTKNRPFREADIQRYMKDLKNGIFVTTHEGLGVTVCKVLLDGQNRLEAIRRTGIAVYMMVTHNVPDFYIINGVKIWTHYFVNVGTKKSAGNHLHMEGIENANKVAA